MAKDPKTDPIRTTDLRDSSLRSLTDSISKLSSTVRTYSTSTIQRSASLAGSGIRNAAGAIASNVGAATEDFRPKSSATAGFAVASAINPIVGKMVEKIVERNQGSLKAAMSGMMTSSRSLLQSVASSIKRPSEKDSQGSSTDRISKSRNLNISKVEPDVFSTRKRRSDFGGTHDGKSGSSKRSISSKHRLENNSYARMYPSDNLIEAIDRLRISNAEWIKALGTMPKSELSDKPLPKAAKGGIVSKTGKAIVHRGEAIVPASQLKAMLKESRIQTNIMQGMLEGQHALQESQQATSQYMQDLFGNMGPDLLDQLIESTLGNKPILKMVAGLAKSFLIRQHRPEKIFGMEAAKYAMQVKQKNPIDTIVSATSATYAFTRMGFERTQTQLNSIIKLLDGDEFGKWNIEKKEATSLFDAISNAIQGRGLEGELSEAFGRTKVGHEFSSAYSANRRDDLKGIRSIPNEISSIFKGLGGAIRSPFKYGPFGMFGSADSDDIPEGMTSKPKAKVGGFVSRTGAAILHKGEHIVPSMYMKFQVGALLEQISILKSILSVQERSFRLFGNKNKLEKKQLDIDKTEQKRETVEDRYEADHRKKHLEWLRKNSFVKGVVSRFGRAKAAVSRFVGESAVGAAGGISKGLTGAVSSVAGALGIKSVLAALGIKGGATAAISGSTAAAAGTAALPAAVIIAIAAAAILAIAGGVIGWFKAGKIFGVAQKDATFRMKISGMLAGMVDIFWKLIQIPFNYIAKLVGSDMRLGGILEPLAKLIHEGFEPIIRFGKSIAKIVTPLWGAYKNQVIFTVKTALRVIDIVAKLIGGVALILFKPQKAISLFSSAWKSFTTWLNVDFATWLRDFKKYMFEFGLGLFRFITEDLPIIIDSVSKFIKDNIDIFVDFIVPKIETFAETFPIMIDRISTRMLEWLNTALNSPGGGKIMTAITDMIVSIGRASATVISSMFDVFMASSELQLKVISALWNIWHEIKPKLVKAALIMVGMVLKFLWYKTVDIVGDAVVGVKNLVISTIVESITAFANIMTGLITNITDGVLTKVSKMPGFGWVSNYTSFGRAKTARAERAMNRSSITNEELAKARASRNARRAAGKVPKAATGGYVSKTGKAIVHAGEYIIPKAATGGYVSKTGKAIVHAGEYIIPNTFKSDSSPSMVPMVISPDVIMRGMAASQVVSEEALIKSSAELRGTMSKTMREASDRQINALQNSTTILTTNNMSTSNNSGGGYIKNPLWTSMDDILTGRSI